MTVVEEAVSNRHVEDRRHIIPITEYSVKLLLIMNCAGNPLQIRYQNMGRILSPGLLIVLVLCTEVACGEGSITDASTKKLIEQLADDSFEVRSAAEAKLTASGKEVMAAVQSATKVGDPESRSRATRILEAIEWNEGAKAEIAWLAAQGPTFGAKTPGSRKATVDASEGVEYKAPAANGEQEVATRHDLEWLSRNQEADGHWDSRKFGAETDADIEQTALAMLAFLAIGNSDRVGMYKDQVQRASEWLIKQQQESGLIARKGECDGTTHAIAGLALAELCGMNPKSKAKDAAQKAIDYSTDNHQCIKSGKGWGFGRDARSKNPNLLMTTFFVMQFKSAKVAALNVKYEAFEGAISFIDSQENGQTNTFRFSDSQFASPKATTLGLLCRMFLGWKRDELTPGVRKVFEDMRADAASNDGDVLMNYISGMVFYQIGGGRWRINGENEYRSLWLEYRTSALKNSNEQQRNDGNARGSWDPKGPWAGAGRVFSTALRSLSLSFW